MNVPVNKLAAVNVTGRRFLATAATQSKRDLRSGQSKDLVRQTKLANGLNIVAIENNSPICRVGIFIRAGPRLEAPGQLGISHALRTAAGLSTQKSTQFGITRTIDYIGGSFKIAATREDLCYVVEALKDDMGAPMKYLADTVSRPAFKPWELGDQVKPRMQIDRARLKESPDVRLLEILHSAAFKGGLSHPLVSPGFMIGKHDRSMLLDYMESNFVNSRMAVVGSGISLEELVDGVERSLQMNSSAPPAIPKSKFVANTIRKATPLPASLVAVASEGAGANNPKDVIALSVFQAAVGGPSRVKYSTGQASQLGAAAASATENPFVLNSINISYSDTGLFGFAVATAPQDIEKVVKSVVKKLREAGKGLTESQLTNAKNALKSEVLQALEPSSCLMDEIGTAVLNGNQPMTPHSLAASIDAITLNDVNSVAARVVKGKVSIAALGQVDNVPYLDDLL